MIVRKEKSEKQIKKRGGIDSKMHRLQKYSFPREGKFIGLVSK